MGVLAPQGMLLKSGEGFFDIIKSASGLVIGGYASIEVVDKQNDLITLEALDDAVHKFMGEKSYRNVMSNHSNVQVGEVIENYRDNNGVLHKTGVDDVGFYVVIKLREDIEKAKEISRGIRKGTLRSFSIGGQAISKKSRTSDSMGTYNEIDKLELHEVTICEKGINPEAKFDILKHENGGDNLSEKLEKALAELNTLLKEVREVTGDEVTKEMDEKGMHEKEMHEKEMMNEKEMHDDEKMEYKEEMDDKEDVDMEEKALDEDSTRDYEAGENVVVNGRPVAAPKELGPISKGLEAADFSTLDLSAENVEKAYAQFRAEQLEKLAYDNLSKQFEARFSEEMDMKKSLAEKAEYDAQTEVSALKEEFAELRKALSEKDDNIRKAAEVAMELPEGFPTTAEAVAEMSWGELHNLARRVN